MGVNKVDLANGETLIDLQNDTVTPETLAEGVTAHNAEGDPIVGTMTAEGGGSAVQSDYAQNDATQPDYIKNRPFYRSEGYSYEWDGTAPDETKKVGESQYYFYKISDNIMTASDLIGARIATSANKTETIKDKYIKKYENGSFAFNYSNYYEMIFVCVEAGSFSTRLGTVELTPGLWFLQAGIHITSFEKDAGIKQIDNEFIPKATAIDDANADLPVTAGLLKTELENVVTAIDASLSAAIGSGVLE